MTTCEIHNSETGSCANSDVKSKLTEMLGMLQKGQMTEGQPPQGLWARNQ